jgi:hypothetical protein
LWPGCCLDNDKPVVAVFFLRHQVPPLFRSPDSNCVIAVMNF